MKELVGSTPAVVDTVLVAAAGILIIFVGMKVFAFIQRIWRE